MEARKIETLDKSGRHLFQRVNDTEVLLTGPGDYELWIEGDDGEGDVIEIEGVPYQFFVCLKASELPSLFDTI